VFISNYSGCQVHRSAPPLVTEVASLNKKVTLALPSHIRGVLACGGVALFSFFSLLPFLSGLQSGHDKKPVNPSNFLTGNY